MKKLLALILAVALLLPAAVLAEERDPIVGLWYMYVDGEQYPEFMSNFGGIDSELSVYYFVSSGLILSLDCQVKDNAATPTFTSVGKWEKSGDQYTFSMIGLGESDCNIKDGVLNLRDSRSQICMKLRQIVPFNPYADYSY